MDARLTFNTLEDLPHPAHDNLSKFCSDPEHFFVFYHPEPTSTKLFLTHIVLMLEYRSIVNIVSPMGGISDSYFVTAEFPTYASKSRRIQFGTIQYRPPLD